MAEPSVVVRVAVYVRDGRRCVSCGGLVLQFQHRQAVGMGGSKKPPTVAQGLTSCATCNPAYESSLHGTALLRGWKVRRWVSDCALVPVYYPLERVWYQLTLEGTRVRLSWDAAVGMMQAVYGSSFDVEAVR